MTDWRGPDGSVAVQNAPFGFPLSPITRKSVVSLSNVYPWYVPLRNVLAMSSANGPGLIGEKLPIALSAATQHADAVCRTDLLFSQGRPGFAAHFARRAGQHSRADPLTRILVQRCRAVNPRRRPHGRVRRAASRPHRVRPSGTRR